MSLEKITSGVYCWWVTLQQGHTQWGSERSNVSLFLGHKEAFRLGNSFSQFLVFSQDYVYRQSPDSTQKPLALGNVTIIITTQLIHFYALFFCDTLSKYFHFCSEGSNLTPAHHYPDFRFKTYAPLAFRYFRELFGIKPDDYLVKHTFLLVLATLHFLNTLFKSLGSVRFLLKEMNCYSARAHSIDQK